MRKNNKQLAYFIRNVTTYKERVKILFGRKINRQQKAKHLHRLLNKKFVCL